MAIFEDKYEITGEILEGLLSGELSRNGSVIRDARKKTFVKMISPIDDEENDEENQLVGNDADEYDCASEATSRQSGGNLAKLITGMLVAAVVGGTAYLYTRKPKQQKCFEDRLKRYACSIRNDCLRTENIDDLLESLDELQLYFSKHKRKKLSFQYEIMQELSFVLRYTFELARKNSIELTVEQIAGYDHADTIVDIRKCVEIQKRLLRMAS